MKWLLLFICAVGANVQAACPNPELPLSQACPELLLRLDQAGLVAPLALDTGALADAMLVNQLEGYLAMAQQPAVASAELDTARLERLIAENYRAAKIRPPSFFEQLAAWWSSLFASDTEGSFDEEFWRKLLPTQTLARLLFVGLTALLAAWIVVYGWRELSPLLQARKRESKAHSAGHSGNTVVWPPTLDQLAPRAALAKLYRALVLKLTEHRRLPDVPGLTPAELVAAFQAGGDGFRQISNAAEQMLFAGKDVGAAALATHVQHADALVREFASLADAANPGTMSTVHA
jgi:hypothetical protein